MTYREREPWIPHADFIQKPLHDRMEYVRKNLSLTEGGPALTQAQFVEAVGALKSGYKAVVRWEKPREDGGHAPRQETRDALATITPYPPEAFLREPGAGVSLASLDARLQELADDVAKATSLMEEALRLLRAAPRRAARGEQSQPKAASG